jgi:hypothetical protein
MTAEPKPGVMPLARELGERLDTHEAIPTLEPITKRPQRMTRKDLWPADEWAKMEKIWRGEEE